MRFAPELEWLKPLFEQRNWELLYLDPSIMEYGAKRCSRFKRWKQDWWDRFRSREAYWRVRHIGNASKKIGKSIEQDFKQDVVRHFVERKLIQKVIGDREVQRQAVGDLEKAISDLATKALMPSCDSVKDLRVGGVIPDGAHEKLESLVVIEGILGQQPQVPPALVGGFPSFTRNHREIRYYLMDRLPHFLKANDPIVGVQVDARAFFQVSRDMERYLTVGWYPYVKVIGHYATLVGGVTFLNALAILFRQFPPADPLFYPHDGLPEQYGFCPTFAIMRSILQKEQEEARSLWSSIKKAQGAGQRNATIDRELRDVDTLRRRNHEMDERLLSPLLWLDLCCKLNGLVASDLSTKAKPLFDCLQQYGQLLLDWGKELKEQGIDSVLAGSQERFLKEEIVALLAPLK